MSSKLAPMPVCVAERNGQLGNEATAIQSGTMCGVYATFNRGAEHAFVFDIAFVQDDLGLELLVSTDRWRKLGWRLFMAAAVICALAVAAAYTTKARRSEPGTVAVGANAFGSTSPPASNDGPVWREARRSSSVMSNIHRTVLRGPIGLTRKRCACSRRARRKSWKVENSLRTVSRQDREGRDVLLAQLAEAVDHVASLATMRCPAGPPTGRRIGGPKNAAACFSLM